MHRKKKSRGKYVVVGFVILLLILAGYLYSQGTFGDIETVIFGNSHGESLQETTTYTSSYTGTTTSSQTNTQIMETTTSTETPSRYTTTEKELFLDDFEKYPVGKFPSGGGWKLVWHGKGADYQVITSAVSYSGDKSLQLWGKPGWSAVAERGFSSSADIMGFEARVYIESFGDPDMATKMVARLVFWNKELDTWGRYYAGVYFRADGKVIVGESTQIAKWNPKRWYTVKVVLDKDSKTFSVYLDGTLIAERIPAYSPDVENINAIALISDHAEVRVYYDDARVFEVSQTSYTTTQTPTYTSTITTTTTTTIPSTVSECSSGYWRYIFEDALKCALTEKELSKVSHLASQLKGNTLQESAWNILEWLDENIDYNYSKSLLPPPIIWTVDGKITSVTAEPGAEIQTPYETIQKGAGVCTDYAILTTALLLEMGYSPVYVFDVEFGNTETGHVTAAVKINGEYFLLDQHPPAMDLGTYYMEWSLYQKELLGKTRLISNATIYEVRKKEGNVIVREIGVVTTSDFKSKDYRFSSTDLVRISEDLKEIFQKNHPNLILDSGIKSLETRAYLPPGYSSGITWKMEFPHFADYYHSVFHDEFVEYFYLSFASYPEIKDDLNQFNRFWIKAVQEGDSIKVILNLARR